MGDCGQRQMSECFWEVNEQQYNIRYVESMTNAYKSWKGNNFVCNQVGGCNKTNKNAILVLI